MEAKKGNDMKRFFALMLAVAMVMMMFVGCSKKQENSSVAGGSSQASEPGNSAVDKSKGYGAYKLAAIYGSITGDYWGIVYNGCQAALDELKTAYGVDGYCMAPANSNDYTLQMDLIETAVLKKVDGIVLSVNNADSIGAFITDFFTEDNMTPILLIDKSCNTTSKAIIGQEMSMTYEMGKDCGKLAAEVMGSKGNYVTLGISPENQNWAERSTGAIDYLKENAPEMVHIPGENPYWMAQVTEDQQLAYVQDTITSNPGPICFITATEGYTNIAVAAISEVSAERQAEIQVIGFDFSKTGYNLIQSGAMYGAVGQNPYLMGHDSIYHMCDYLKTGEIAEFTAVPYTVVTKNNLEDPSVVEYLKTMGIVA